MSKTVRVSTLAKELGMTSKQVIELCSTIGVGVVAAGSSMVEAQADRVRRHAEEKGLKGEPIVDKPKRAKKAAAGDEEAKPKTTRAKKSTKSTTESDTTETKPADVETA
ncbi:MAG: translation initiation factor IF-2 N-terminal domain-containing protein, partial [Ilumatobacteraceae bacterium]